MSRAPSPLVSLLTVAALAFSGCADLPPGETGMFSNNAAVSAGSLARAGGTASAEAQATGSSTGAMVSATINVITIHQATERQRRVAQSRARAALAELRARQQRAAAAAPKTKKPLTKKSAPGDSAKPKSRTAASIQEVDVTRPTPKRKLPRYIAVDTVKDERTSPRAEKAVMIFDTQTEEIVGNNVYDVRSTPPVGGTARFETFTAEYVGVGG